MDGGFSTSFARVAHFFSTDHTSKLRTPRPFVRSRRFVVRFFRYSPRIVSARTRSRLSPRTPPRARYDASTGMIHARPRPTLSRFVHHTIAVAGLVGGCGGSSNMPPALANGETVSVPVSPLGPSAPRDDEQLRRAPELRSVLPSARRGSTRSSQTVHARRSIDSQLRCRRTHAIAQPKRSGQRASRSSSRRAAAPWTRRRRSSVLRSSRSRSSRSSAGRSTPLPARCASRSSPKRGTSSRILRAWESKNQLPLGPRARHDDLPAHVARAFGRERLRTAFVHADHVAAIYQTSIIVSADSSGVKRRSIAFDAGAAISGGPRAFASRSPSWSARRCSSSSRTTATRRNRAARTVISPPTTHAPARCHGRPVRSSRTPARRSCPAARSSRATASPRSPTFSSSSISRPARSIRRSP